MTGRPHVWLPHRVTKLRTLWEQGWTIAQIADAIGVSSWAVKQARDYHGLAPRANGRPAGRPKKPAATIGKAMEKSNRMQVLPSSSIPWPTPAQMMGRR